MTEPQSPFEVLPNGHKVQFAWDATSISTFKACPRKYYYSMIRGLRAKERAAPLEFGGYLHDMLEHYDRLKAKGATHDEAVFQTVKYGLIMTCQYEVDAEGKRVLDEEGRPKFKLWETDDNTRSRYTLIRAFVWFTEQYENDPLVTHILPDGKPALELSFRLEIGLKTPGGQEYLWCGHIDKVARVQDKIYIQERKHTKTTLSPSYFDRYSPNTQVTGYIFSGTVVLNEPVVGAFIDATQVAVGFNRNARGIQSRTNGQLEEWFKNQIFWMKLAEQCAIEGNYPMNEESCSNFGGCPYRPVCSRDEKVRETFLKADYTEKVWNPLKDREALT